MNCRYRWIDELFESVGVYIVRLFIIFVFILVGCIPKKNTSTTSNANKSVNLVETATETKSAPSMALEEIPAQISSRPDLQTLTLSNIHVVDYAMSGKDGDYYAPAIIFATGASQPDYLTYQACPMDGTSSCMQGEFGESGEALCGFGPGTYSFSITACLDSVWGSKAGCTNSFSAKAPYILKPTTSPTLKVTMTEQCALRAKVHTSSQQFYSHLASLGSKRETEAKGSPSDLNAKNCSNVINSALDPGPHHFANLFAYYHRQMVGLAKEGMSTAQDSNGQSLQLADAQYIGLLTAAIVSTVVLVVAYLVNLRYRLKALGNAYTLNQNGETKIITKADFDQAVEDFRMIEAAYRPANEAARPGEDLTVNEEDGIKTTKLTGEMKALEPHQVSNPKKAVKTEQMLKERDGVPVEVAFAEIPPNGAPNREIYSVSVPPGYEDLKTTSRRARNVGIAAMFSTIAFWVAWDKTKLVDSSSSPSSQCFADPDLGTANKELQDSLSTMEAGDLKVSALLK